ncbi:MAG: Rieske 2Fe-2S domain-containing protein, partial [Robiginitalea sp.]
MAQKFSIDPDIRRASTLPSSFYRDPQVYEAIKEKVFCRSWQWIGDEGMLGSGSYAYPFVLLENFLDEPMVLTRDSKGEYHCLSNVCTHRGYMVVTEAGKTSKLRCSYHGRRFKTDGAFEFMPEFGQARDFPRSCDDLNRFPVRRWGPL